MSEWIDTRRPDKSGYYLTWIGHTHKIAWFDKNNDRWDTVHASKIKAWMDLPPPPDKIYGS